MTGAIIGSSVIGAVSSSNAGRKASNAADAANQQAKEASMLQYKASQEQLDFQKKQYADWEGIFGPIQQNLSSYYQNMSPTTFESLGIQNIEQQYTSSRQNLDEALAKRGITNSGATVAGLTELERTRMMGKAEVSVNAPMQVAEQQSKFLSLGLGQQAGLQSGISNSYSNQMNILGQQSANSQQQANTYAGQAAAGYAGVGSSIGAGISTYMQYNALNPQAQQGNIGYYNPNGSVNYSGGFQGPNLR